MMTRMYVLGCICIFLLMLLCVQVAVAEESSSSSSSATTGTTVTSLSTVSTKTTASNTATSTAKTKPHPGTAKSNDSTTVQTTTAPLVTSPNHNYTHAVKVFHFLIGHWGQSRHGVQECGQTYCEWVLSDHMKHLKDNFHFLTEPRYYGLDLTTVSVYNIHSWWERVRDYKPASCELRTNLTFTETEESFVRYSHLFDPSFKQYDGFSSTHPKSSVQRIYIEAYLNASHFLPLRNFTSLIKGGSYVASDCHRKDTANANRDQVIQDIRNAGFRVDGLGRCMHTNPGPEGVSLPKTRDTRYNLYLKRETIGHFMFYMAFENSLESGYVTEKPFDALISGTVPVYLGDAEHLKKLIPHPKAVIFLADFKNDATALVEYLTYLTKNETAYEEHRDWRKGFDYHRNIAGKPLMEKSWWCRICEWAVEEAPKHHKRTRLCLPPAAERKAENHQQIKLGSEWEAVAVRPKSSRQIYLVKDGILRPIPDLNTFLALKLELDKVKPIEDSHMENLIVGDELQRLNP